MPRLAFSRCYNQHQRVHPGEGYDEGELVAVKLRSQWHRARFIQYKPNIDFAHVCDSSLLSNVTDPCVILDLLCRLRLHSFIAHPDDSTDQ